MADITRPTAVFGQATTQVTRSLVRPANQDVLAHSGAVTGEAIDAGQPVVLQSDGMYYRADANSGTATLKRFHGLAAKYAAAGEAITVVYQGHMGGFTGLTPGATYYVSDTVGELADAAGTVNLKVGRAINATTILVIPNLT